jgi:hypothetical protein
MLDRRLECIEIAVLSGASFNPDRRGGKLQ